MGLEGGDGLGLDVARQANLHSDPTVGAPLNHRLRPAVHRIHPHAVPEPLRAAGEHGVVRGLPARGLGGVEGALEPALADGREGALVQQRGEARLGAREVKAHHAALAVAPGQARLLFDDRRIEVADAADDHADGYVERELRVQLALQHGVHHLRQLQPAVRVQHRRESQLQVAHAVVNGVGAGLHDDAPDGVRLLHHAERDVEGLEVLLQRLALHPAQRGCGQRLCGVDSSAQGLAVRITHGTSMSDFAPSAVGGSSTPAFVCVTPSSFASSTSV